MHIVCVQTSGRTYIKLRSSYDCPFTTTPFILELPSLLRPSLFLSYHCNIFSFRSTHIDVCTRTNKQSGKHLYNGTTSKSHYHGHQFDLEWQCGKYAKKHSNQMHISRNVSPTKTDSKSPCDQKGGEDIMLSTLTAKFSNQLKF